ncbi:hypothetical protein MJT46_006093 [Ovis ammon polii x Ovis aries]|uniref:Uncharacterized protein n=1 Tax=Ovis aries TaxID=9940 RepID=A0A836A5A2_SHEEP|nr:hypothetical protein JEQ12_015654 [Ovis aries]KAI4570576.1 hypothetical protein MJT46_006093 [Ovis ammon polii x Ovis aries]
MHSINQKDQRKEIPKIKTAVAPLTTRQQKQSLQERTAGLSLITHGDFIRILLLRSMLGHQKIRFLSKWKENCEYPVPTRHERTVSTEIKTITSEIFPRVDED